MTGAIGPVHAHLKYMLDAYTLMAFLQETPDVQSAINKMFKKAKVWVDTSVILPLLAEELFEQEDGAEKKTITNMIHSAIQAGMNLYVTSGVIEEVSSHLRLCKSYIHNQRNWVGGIPFFCAAFARSGRRVIGMSGWLERYRGDERPEQDIRDYLWDEHGVDYESLEDSVMETEATMRGVVTEEWIEAHRTRRARSEKEVDEMMVTRLAHHDVECFLGVLERRKTETDKEYLGYEHWWLTLDSAAYKIYTNLKREGLLGKMDSPLMTPDFLVNYLSLGPNRQRISKENEAGLPLIVAGDILYELPNELIQLADQVRANNQGLPERIVRRKVRDALDRARRRVGPIAQAGISGIEERLDFSTSRV